MKTSLVVLGPITVAFIAACSLRADTAASAQINKLLADAKAEAVALKADAADMDTFARSTLNWESYAVTLAKIKAHVNNAGKLLAQLQAVKAQGEPWQQAAIDRAAPLLKQMDDNTETTINQLNENTNRVHFPEFKNYVRAHYELAIELYALIRDSVDYSSAEAKFLSMNKKLEASK